MAGARIVHGPAGPGRAAPGRRADVALVERGIVRSRALARRLIEDGAVDLVDGPRTLPLARPSQLVHDDQALTIRASAESRYVSRAGAKLDGALAATGLAVAGLAVLDVGMSTGGFADCLLAAGAARVVGIEVGHGQLAPTLAADPRIVCVEKTDIRAVDRARLAGLGLPAAGAERIVVDLSFISALGQLAHLATLAAPSARLAMLVKPQFELGPKALDSRGIVRADADLRGLETRARDTAAAAGWHVDAWLRAALAGTDGNQEYFLIATRTGGASCPVAVREHDGTACRRPDGAAFR